MSKKPLNIGTVANDGTGDPLRTTFANIKDNFDELYENKDVVGAAVSSSIILANQEVALDATGKMVAYAGTWWKVSNFIPINSGVKLQAYNRKESYNFLCYAFYEAEDESTFISGFKAPDTSSYNAVLNVYEGIPVIPEGANYIRVSGNTNYTGVSIYVKHLKSIKDVVTVTTPVNPLIYFTNKVNINRQNYDVPSVEVCFPYEESDDYAALRLPDGYDPYANPYPLIIYNHGAGSPVTANSSNISNDWALYLAKKGFAILDCNALPNGLKKAWMHPTQCANFGSEFAVNSVLTAYKYVTDNYNIAKDKCFILGQSMGGLLSGNLINSGRLPVRAVWLDAPVTGLYENAWVKNWWANADSGVMIHMTIAFLFGFKNWDEGAKTFTVLAGNYAGTYSFTTILTTEPNGQAKLNAFYEENKALTIGLNPWTNKKISADIILYGVPLTISHGTTDATVDITVSKSYMEKLKNGGNSVMFHEMPTNTHTLFAVGDAVADEEGISACPIPIEVVRFFKRYL